MYAKQRILVYHFAGTKSPTISMLLKQEGINVSRVGVWKFLRKYKRTGAIGKLEGGGRRRKITPEVKLIVEEQMKKDDETTAVQLHKLLTDRGISISTSTILRC